MTRDQVFISYSHKDKSDTTPRAVQACHELLAWLIPLLDQFPRSRRFTLGERLESGLLAVLEELVEAAYTTDKRPALWRANRRLALCRHLRALTGLNYGEQIGPIGRLIHPGQPSWERWRPRRPQLHRPAMIGFDWDGQAVSPRRLG